MVPTVHTPGVSVGFLLAARLQKVATAASRSGLCRAASSLMQTCSIAGLASAICGLTACLGVRHILYRHVLVLLQPSACGFDHHQ